jgi:hypothetical protein
VSRTPEEVEKIRRRAAQLSVTVLKHTENKFESLPKHGDNLCIGNCRKTIENNVVEMQRLISIEKFIF